MSYSGVIWGIGVSLRGGGGSQSGRDVTGTL